MERAIHDTASQLSPGYSASLTFFREYPPRPDLLALTRVWRREGDADGEYIVVSKGAPEEIVVLYHLDPAERDARHAYLAKLTAEGPRALGVAQA